MRLGHVVRALGACKLRKCAEHKVRAKIRTHFRKACRETSFELSLCRTSLLFDLDYFHSGGELSWGSHKPTVVAEQSLRTMPPSLRSASPEFCTYRYCILPVLTAAT